MKKVLFLLVFVFLLFAAETGTAGENLLKNGSFENIDGGLPDVWSTDIYGDDLAGVRFSVENKGAYDGSNYATIENIRSNDAKLIQSIKVKPDTVYKLSCRIKAEGIGGNALGANITVLYILETSQDFKDTGGKWKYVELYGRTGKEQSTVIVTARLGGYGNVNIGKASFDDFRLEEIIAVPESVKVIKFHRQGSEFDKTKSRITLVVGLLVILGLLSGAVCFVLFRGTDTIHTAWQGEKGIQLLNQAETEQTVLTKKDYIIITVLTLVYLALGLINLGSLKSPQTFWKPAKDGETFLIDLGQIKEIGRIGYYLGLGKGSFKLELSEYGKTWQDLEGIKNKTKFKPIGWEYIKLNDKARYVKVTCEEPGTTLNEIVFLAPDSKAALPVVSITNIDVAHNAAGDGKPELVFDEQETLVYTPGSKNMMYFDEVYFARTAYEHLHKLEPTETTHPPLGKVIISFGIAMFGMNPFGWRIMGVLFGTALLPVMYIFSFRLFKKSSYAFISSFLLAFDFMHFFQMRISTVDVYAIFFIFLMYYYIYQYFNMNFFHVGLKKTLLPLLLSGIFFGLGSACKWIALYGALGLVVILLTYFVQRFCDYRQAKNLLSRKDNKVSKIKRKESMVIVQSFSRYVSLTILWCLVAFVLIPSLIYVLSYIPFMMVPGPGHELENVIACQKHMYDYHSELQASHFFSSTWWEWPIIRKPLWAYSGTKYLPDDKISSIVSMGNPAVWWVGSLAVIISAVMAVLKKERAMYVVLVAIAAQYLPWILIPRKLLFIYHFYAIVPFMILCITYVIVFLTERLPKFKYVTYVYLAIVLVLFVMFYPILSGTVVNKSYVATYLRWFDGWFFF